jgi:lipid-A-disaccharide synthase
MVVTYRANRVSYAIAKRLVRIPYAALPNILAGEFLVPELLQDDATPENLAQALLNMLGDATVMEALPERFAEIHEALRQGTGERAAAALLPFIERGAMRTAA